MLKKLFVIILMAASLAGCTNKEVSTNESLSLADDKSYIVGTWAMIPLRNGISNVAEYKSGGVVVLHPFNCAEPSEPEVEVSEYTVADDGQSIHIKSPMDEFDLNVIDITRKTMQLGMNASGSDLLFAYVRVKQVTPLCFLYGESDAQKSKHTPYQDSDFVPDPIVPAHADMDRYAGEWVDEDGAVMFEVRQDSAGTASLLPKETENWNILVNDVHWVGEELVFQSFAYSDKEELFKHPFHKSSTKESLTPMSDGRMRWSIYLGDDRKDQELKRKG